MSVKRRTYRKQRERHIYVKAERRDPPDVARLSKALLARAQEMARAQAEADAARALREPSRGSESADV